MKSIIYLLLSLLTGVSCTADNRNFVGSTPGDGLIKSMLSIPATTTVDFINWQLELKEEATAPNSFKLSIHFGASQPNTLGFINGGEKQTFEGTFTVAKNENSEIGSEIYRLKSKNLPKEISLLKISENLLHLVTAQNQLMVGNGGWSYSLHRKERVGSNKMLISSSVRAEKSLQLIFDGRTPCREMTTAYPEMKADASCFKLKWKLVLNRDSLTLLPTTCSIRNVVDNQPRDIAGTWTIINGTATNPQAIIYKIQVDRLAEPILFFAADENVLFFIDQNYQPLIGNENFSFAMNKRQ